MGRRQKECKSKIKYNSKTAACASLCSGKRRGHFTKQYSIYSCQFCGGWHVGRRKKIMTSEIHNQEEKNVSNILNRLYK